MRKQDITLMSQHHYPLSSYERNVYLLVNNNYDFLVTKLDQETSALKLVAKIYWDTKDKKNSFLTDHESKSSNYVHMVFIGNQTKLNEFLDIIKNNNLKINLSQLKSHYGFDFTSQINDEETYRWLSTTHEPNYLSFLKVIRDAATSINVFKNIKNNKNFIKYNLQKILVDNSATNYAYTKGYNIILSRTMSPVYEMKRADELFLPSDSGVIRVSFTNNLKIDNPIHAIIGKNGSGKTHHIKRFLTQYFKNYGQRIYSTSEIFNRIILISNTVDDNGYTPSRISRNKSKRSNYHFISNTSLKHYNNINSGGSKININDCVENIIFREITRSGIFDKAIIADEIISILNLNVNILIKSTNSFQLVHSINEALDFFKNEKAIHNTSVLNLSDVFLEITFLSGNEKTNLSSGQNTFLIKTLSILMTIETNSLVIVEEPENFLHPNLLISLMTILKKILTKTNSCCLISTHSPLVLRELPKEQVTIFNRHNNVTSHRSPTIETFGSDATELYHESFSELETDAAYRETIYTMAKSEPSVEGLLQKYSNLPSNLLTKIINEWRRK
ncbi:AAA family ATPase [Klebsiella pneumoniae]|uniref:AAA family ATPase n=1 Tax=Klebsiella pneumoniae TaxID=573 RepID=UPI0039B4C2B3